MKLARTSLRRPSGIWKRRIGPPAALLAGLLAMGAANAQPRFGALTGLVLDAARHPVPGATVTAAQVDGSAVRGTVSGSDGVYSFADMPPGAYAVIAQAAGCPEVTVPAVQVTAGRAARADVAVAAAARPASIPLQTAAAPPPLVSSAVPALVPPAAARPASIPLQTAAAPADSFWKRWLKGEPLTREDLESPAPLTASVRPIPSAPALPPDSAPQPATAPQTPPAPSIPEALQSPPSSPGVDNFTPFAYGDFTWLNGTSRNKDTVLDTRFFTPEIRFDTNFIEDFNQPVDHSMGGSTEQFRSGEVQVEQASVGGDFHWQNVRGRILTMFGMFATTTPRNDASAGVGQWDLRDAYRYVSEAWGGYHFNVSHGLNVDAGIFVSYIGLFSYYNFDNWTYQPSFVSSNTPWFFNGLRIQWFPTKKLKIEPWIINGWQSYAKYNGHRGPGRADPLPPARMAFAGVQQLRQWNRRFRPSRPLPHPHRRQHRGALLQ